MDQSQFLTKHQQAKVDGFSYQDFEGLYDTYWEKVFAVCYHNTKDVELAKEMTQDIFKSIWERRANLHFEKSPEHYLVRAAKLKVAEHFRNQATRKKHLDEAVRDYSVAANYTQADVSYSLLVEELDLLVEKLPFQCRNVFHMSRNQGLTNKEIAIKLSISQRAVEYHISKALTYLREHLKAYKL